MAFAAILTLASSHMAYLQSSHNTTQHSLTGNRNKHSTGYRILHWNKGNTHFHNKINDISHIIETHTPHIMSLSEANVLTNIDTNTYHLHDYNIETTSMAQITGISRTALIIKDNIHYTRRHDLEDSHTSTIWIEIHVHKHKSLLLMAGYRQWQLPNTHPQHTNSHLNTAQHSRFKDILQKWSMALQEHKHTIVLMDDNINTTHHNTHNARYNIQALQDTLTQHMHDNNIVIHNNTPTHFSHNTTPSCIDHIYSNCPTLLHNTTTLHTGASDHSILTTQYNTRNTTTQPTHISVRPRHLLTQHSLEQHIQHSLPLQQLFQSHDANTVADTLMYELNLIINTIAPARTIQATKHYTPYIDSDTLIQIKQRQHQYTQACNTNNTEDWRLYRHNRNILNRHIESLKTQYFKHKFTHTHSSSMWSTLKKHTNTSKAHTPKHIIHNTALVTSPKRLATIANQHYINKITRIRHSFKTLTLNPINILTHLIPRSHNTFILPLITLTQTLDILTKAKGTHSTGHDAITMHTLKKIKHTIAPHITHLINTIIRTNTFPNTFKHSRITPISKPGKLTTLIDSFRPINNLCTLDKVVEQHIKIHLDTFLTQHNIIQHNHHGGRHKHSTTTALAQIYNTLHTQHELGTITATLQTDLSAAFDTVDTKILLDKLEHYGIRDGTLTLFTSYLTHRTQYVEIDTFKSHTQHSPQCSVIQGGKLSGTLYTLYTNEIPLLHKLMSTQHYDFITQTPHTTYHNITHTTVNFVDDSTNLISSHNALHLSHYLTDFYTLLHAYYTLNKLKINADKTELLLTCKPHLRSTADTITMHAHNHTIHQRKVTKILGALINNTLTHTDHINKVVSGVNYRIHTLTQIKRYTDMHTRRLIANATIISTLSYILPLLINAHSSHLAKLQRLLLKSARVVIGTACYRWSTFRILNACSWHSIYHMITIATTTTLHKIIAHKTPQSLYSLLASHMHNTYSNRHVRTLHLKHRAHTDQLNNTFLYKAVSIYNTLPHEITALDTTDFRARITSYVSTTHAPDKIPDRIT